MSCEYFQVAFLEENHFPIFWEDQKIVEDETSCQHLICKGKSLERKWMSLDDAYLNGNPLLNMDKQWEKSKHNNSWFQLEAYTERVSKKKKIKRIFVCCEKRDDKQNDDF